MLIVILYFVISTLHFSFLCVVSVFCVFCVTQSVADRLFVYLIACFTHHLLQYVANLSVALCHHSQLDVHR